MITTARLQLRPLALADEALYCDLYGDAETMRFIAPPLSTSAAQRSFHAALNSAPDQYWFGLHSTTAAVGLCGVTSINADRTEAEIGLLLCTPARGHGLATEGLAALRDWAFDALPVAALTVCYQEHNQAAQRLAERVGFRGHTSNALTGVVARLDRQQWRADPLIKKGH